LAGTARLNGMRLRRQVMAAVALGVAATATASLALLSARANDSRAMAAAAALRAQERGWHAVEALLAEPQRVAANAVPLHRVALPSRQGDAATSITWPEIMFGQVAAVTGAVPVLTDGDGRVVAFPAGAAKLARAAERLRGVDPGIVELVVGDRLIAAATVPLRDTAGNVVGARRWLTDVTEQRWAEDRDDLLAAGAVLGVALLLAAAMTLWLRQAFGPIEQALAAQAALAAGDLTVALPSPSRAGEIGIAARALAVFRDSRLRLRRQARTDAWQRQLRRRFLEAESTGLQAVFEEPDGAALRRILQQLLAEAACTAAPDDGATRPDPVGAALSALAEQLRRQHAELRSLRGAQRDAADGAQRLGLLEREFGALAALPTRLAAPAVAAASGIAAVSFCLPAPAFGGDFHDVFWLDGAERRRLAVLMASVHGVGVEAALLAVSVRALVRALAPDSVSPGACLSRVSDLVLRDNDKHLPIAAWFGCLDLRSRSLTAACAAAPPPLLLTRPGEVRVLAMPSAPALGLRPGTSVPDNVFDLPQRAALAVVSRGAPKALQGGSSLDIDAFAAMLAGSPGLDPEVLLAHAMAAVTTTGEARAGDASMVAVRLSGGDQPPRRNP